jgi:hypothetical protein
MKDPDTSDLYKFFATLGVLLISGACIAIWVLSIENSVLLINRETLESLTAVAKENIESRQEFLN